MKVCILTNLLNKGFIEDEKIIRKSSKILNADIFDHYEKNIYHKINKNYDKVLIKLNLHINNILFLVEVIEKIKIEKTFIISSIPKKEIDIQKLILNFFNNKGVVDYNYIKHVERLLNLSDKFIFFSDEDRLDFFNYYKIDYKESRTIIPSLQNENNFEVNFNNLKNITNNICFENNIDFKRGLHDFCYVMQENNINCNLNIFGHHGLDERKEEELLNHFTSNNKNIKFHGMNVYGNDFFFNNSFYMGISLYDTFSINCLEYISYGLIPLLSTGSHYSKLLKDYPFIIDVNDQDNYLKLFEKIDTYNISDLYDMLVTANKLLSQYNNNNFLNNTINFLNE